jgi:peptidoglycan/LPS O-acetylase OafA/YrhL
MIKNKINYPALTGIRAIAAFMVYIHHFNPFSANVFGNSISGFFAEFHVGVTIFFVLSGFLIANRYCNESQFNFKKYFLKRFARIFPMYFLLTTATFLFFAIFQSVSLFEQFKSYLINITFFRGFLDDLKFTGIAQGWSLTVEECFYFLAPLFFLLVKKNKIYLFLIPIVTVSIGFLLVFLFTSSDNSGFMNSNNFMLDFTIFGRVSEFIIGLALSIFINEYKFKLKYITHLGVFMVFFFIYLLSIIDPLNGYGTELFFGKIINNLLLPLFGISLLFYGLITEKTFLSKILSSNFFQLLGKSSYVFYLIHMGLVLDILNKVSTNLFFSFICLNIISISLYLFVEKPINDYLRSKI